MDEKIKIDHIIKSCDSAIQRWDELSEGKKDFYVSKMMEVNKEILKENERLKTHFEQELEDLEAELAVRNAFLKEKGLEKQFETFLHAVVSDFLKETHRARLTLVK